MPKINFPLKIKETSLRMIKHINSFFVSKND